MQEQDIQLAARCARLAEQSRHAATWLADNRETVGSECTTLQKEMRRAARFFGKCEQAARRKMCVGVFGPSQSGKSYLISALARDSRGDLLADFCGRTSDFITEINPEGGKESTGLVTRFTTTPPQGLTPDFPIRLRLLSEMDVVRVLANTYYADAANTFYRFRADVKGNGKALTCGGLSYTEEDLRIEPKAALVLWYSCLQTSYLPWIQASPVVLSSVKFKKDGYIYFDTPETFVNGNVVIVAIDKELGYDQIEADADKRITNAEVLWSWNIVFSEGYDPDAAENWIVKGGYTWMNRDLGALIDPEQAYIGGQLNNVALASTTGNCYQWGRKDPFPGLPDYTSVQVSYMTGLWFAPAYTPIPALDRGTFEAWGRQPKSI